jgi:hypothetical protein
MDLVHTLLIGLMIEVTLSDGPNRVVLPILSPEDGNSPVSEMLCSLEYQTVGKSKNSAFLIIILFTFSEMHNKLF